jgi:NADPH:quinone reductase-like Zn-dependent oxidoreductase
LRAGQALASSPRSATTRRQALAQAAGADHIVNYRNSGAADEIRGVFPDGVT